MVAYVLRGSTDHLFDPAVGAGIFFHAAQALARQMKKHIKLLGTELDPAVLVQAQRNGLSQQDLAHVQITDFVLRPPRGPFQAIVANPPYIRHHRLSPDVKTGLRAFGATLLGRPLDGRAGLHVYFLLRALQLLAHDGRLAFIMPADTCEGVFATDLWQWVTTHYRLEALVTFTPEASPFPGVDTNAIIFMIRNAPPQPTFLWVKCMEGQTDALKEWVLSGLNQLTGTLTSKTLLMKLRTLSEALTTGLSREGAGDHPVNGPILADFARVLRGIATGANEFFWLSRERAHALAIPDEYLLPAVGRTRDVPSGEITKETVKTLEVAGRPTLLLSLDGRPKEQLPPAVRTYVEHGERLGLHQRALISTRNPWYKMETRQPPPFLFAYLGRRNARFIRNRVGVIPLTGFLCVYPHDDDPIYLNKLWHVLQHHETVARLAWVGKSYGGGAIKVEPRALERLPLPLKVVEEIGLRSPSREEQFKFSYH